MSCLCKYISWLTFILKAIIGTEPASGWWSAGSLTPSCALFASLYIPMRTRCKRKPSVSTAIQTDKMSKAKEFGSCPDMYRSLNTAELRELLKNDDKIDQIIVLDEKVMPFFLVFFSFFVRKPNVRSCFCCFGSLCILITNKSCSICLTAHVACVATDRVSIKPLICAGNI